MASGVCAMARKYMSAEDVAVPQVYVGRWRSEGDVLCVTIGANGRWVLESKERLADGSISYYSEAIRGDAMHGWKEPPEPSLGTLLNVGMRYISRAPTYVIGPTAILILLALGFSLLADALNAAVNRSE